MSLTELIKKYDVPVPRYTSYPTVPLWQTDKFTVSGWWEAVAQCFNESNDLKGISLYVHLPFCESLCTYCACNTRITKNHAVESGYVDSVLAEWAMYKERFSAVPVIRELHLGGGTPTFFSSGNLSRLVNGLLKGCRKHPRYEFSFEGHPNNTTLEHLTVLAGLGFNRVSFGVQDLDIKVQTAINRIQPFENLERVVKASRELGYQSIGFDLIYGLPYQTVESVTETVNKVISLRPDRIAFYSYAHVPWLRPGQRGYEDADLPSDVTKRSLYETGRTLFHNAGYRDIGMDHFALPDDALSVAVDQGRLHRNFMGYTTSQTDLLIGLGTSAINDAKYAFAQNLKKVEDYQSHIRQNESAVFKGHLHTAEDMLYRRIILDIACKGELSEVLLTATMDETTSMQLEQMEREGLVKMHEKGMSVTPTGRVFVRNICNVFDKRSRDGGSPASRLFSKAI